MSRRFALLLVLAACDVPTINERPAALGAQRAPDRIPPISIHGGNITRVAITERADVALTIDSINDARLWPALDGTREPVQLELGQTRVATIAHAGSDELVIGVIDAADNASIVRVTRDGAIRGRVAIPGELVVKQLAAIDGGVIAVRADQSIERYDANGVLHGKLVGDPGEQFGALAVRGDGAAVLVVKPDASREAPPAMPSPNAAPAASAGPFASDVRFIVVGDGLGAGLVWGPRRALSKPVETTTLAFAPDHHKLAVVDADAAFVQVLDAADLHQLGEPMLLNNGTTALGFSDNDNLAVISGVITWWPVAAHSSVARAFGGAVGDHLVVAGALTSLELDTREQQHFLGWNDDANGSLSAVGDGFALGDRNGKLKLLDDRLQVTRELDLAGTRFTPNPTWIDPTHAVFEQSGDGKVQVVLVDFAHLDRPTVIGSYDYLGWIEYAPQLHQLALVDENAVHRFAIDPKTYATTKLPDLHGPASRVHLLDPVKSGGVVAVGLANTYSGSFTHFEWRGAEPTASESSYESSTLLGTGEDGTLYVYGGGELSAIRKRETQRIAKTNELGLASISDDGALIAVADSANVTMYDSSGHELWHHDLWEAAAMVFSKDRRRIAVSSRGGLVELDAATGERLAAVCAFGFGMHDTGWQQRASNEPTVCEDSP